MGSVKSKGLVSLKKELEEFIQKEVKKAVRSSKIPNKKLIIDTFKKRWGYDK